MSDLSIRDVIASAIEEYKADTGQAPARLQVSAAHLSELQYSTYDHPGTLSIPLDYIEVMETGAVRCIAPETNKSLHDLKKAQNMPDWTRVNKNG